MAGWRQLGILSQQSIVDVATTMSQVESPMQQKTDVSGSTDAAIGFSAWKTLVLI
jgi:hypothetical protein